MLGKRVSPSLPRAGLDLLIPVQCGAHARSTKAGHGSTACIKQVHSERVLLREVVSVNSSYRAKVNSVGGFSWDVKLAQKVLLAERGLSLNRMLSFQVVRGEGRSMGLGGTERKTT